MDNNNKENTEMKTFNIIATFSECGDAVYGQQRGEISIERKQSQDAPILHLRTRQQLILLV